MKSTDTFLAQVDSYYSEAWRNFGIMWAYLVFNVVAALGIYWWARVPKGNKTKGSA
jgi:ABC-type multidrug transport system permease subunit